MTYEDFRAIVMSFPGVEEGTSYGEPAFEVVTASFDQPLTRRMSLQLSIYNLTNAYPNLYETIGGYPNGSNATPLENGLRGVTPANVVGPSTARLNLHVDL